MKKLEDIILKKGDVVTIQTPYGEKTIIVEQEQNALNFYSPNLIKIERPIKYEFLYEAPRPILDKEEKEYLEAVIRPFATEIKFIKKTKENLGNLEFIEIVYRDICGAISLLFPSFKKNTMYKGMELDKEYTLKELGLFKE